MQGVRPFSPAIMTTAPGGGGGCSANCRINGRGDLFDDILALRAIQERGGKLFEPKAFLWGYKSLFLGN